MRPAPKRRGRICKANGVGVGAGASVCLKRPEAPAIPKGNGRPLANGAYCNPLRGEKDGARRPWHAGVELIQLECRAAAWSPARKYHSVCRPLPARQTCPPVPVGAPGRRSPARAGRARHARRLRASTPSARSSGRLYCDLRCRVVRVPRPATEENRNCQPRCSHRREIRSRPMPPPSRPPRATLA